MTYYFRTTLFVAACFISSWNLQAENPDLYSVAPAFIPNCGQIIDFTGATRPDILFSASANGVNVYFRKNGISYVFTKPFPETSDGMVADESGHRIDMNWKTSSHEVELTGETAANSYRNFYYEHCPNGIVHVPAFEKLVYRNLFDKVDAVFYFTNGGMKYDYIVHPGGNPADIRFSYAGQIDLNLTNSGSLILDYGFGKMEELNPVSYQDGIAIGGTNFVPGDGFGFSISGGWNPSADLVIDPSVLWSTYFGGTGLEFTLLASDIDLDSYGNVYFASHTSSTNFPTSIGAYQTSNQGGTQDAVAAKFNTTGAMVWSTYFGTSGEDIASGCKIDRKNRMYFTGHTTSNAFPVTSGAFQTSFGGVQDAILVKLSASGTIVWSSFLGGNGIEDGNRVSLDTNDNLLITGSTVSPNFPIGPGAFQPVNGGSNDFFVMKFDSTSKRIFGTFFGAIGNDFGSDITSDIHGNVFVVGSIGSSALTQNGNSFQPSYGGGVQDIAVAKFSPLGAIIWSSYYGGTGDDTGLGIDCDLAGNAFFTGYTTSGNFPVSSGAYMGSKPNSNFAGYLVKFDANGNRKFATYFGGNTWERFFDVTVNINDEACVTGDSRSTNMPVTANAHQPVFGGGFNDAAIVKFSNSGALTYSSFIGGLDQENGKAIAAGENGRFYVLGNTKSSNFPLTGTPQQGSYSGNTDGFIMGFYDCPNLAGDIGMGDTSYVCIGSNITFSVDPAIDTILWSTGSTSSSITVSASTTYWVSVSDAGCDDSDTTFLVVQTFPSVSATANGSTSICDGTSVTLTATGGVTYQWKLNGIPIPGAISSTWAATQAGGYTVVCYNEGGCSDSTTTPINVTVKASPVFSLGNDTILCPGDTLVLNAPAFPAHFWCSGGSAPALYATTTGMYCVTAVNSQNCSTSDSLNLTVKTTPLASFTYVISNQTTVQFTSTSTGASSWSWNFGDGDASTFQNPIHFYDSLLNYIACLTVVESGGLLCDHTFCDTIWLDPISIDLVAGMEGILIYPNPAEDFLMVEFKTNSFSGTVFQLTDLRGQNLSEWTFKDRGTGIFSIPLGKIAAGTYFLHIEQSGRRIVKKVMIGH